MPKRTDIHSVLIIGAGPIIIGQACEFDYSGTQACKALREEGYRVVLVNSNPATIMTDPEFADRTYIEPITPECIEKIIARERPNVPPGMVFALLPTMGGQTALNCALSLRKMGTLEKFNVKMIGATADAIDKAEDRGRFREAMTKIGLETPRSIQTKNLPDALQGDDENDPDDPAEFEAVAAVLKQVRPIHEFVKVDVFVPGCPPPADAIFFVVSALLAGRNYPSPHDIKSIAQDWDAWLARGDMDFVCPMNYFDTVNRFTSYTRIQLALPNTAGRVYPGIGVTAHESRLDAVETIDQIRAARAAGAYGFMLYDLNEALRQEILPALRLGISAE